MIPYLIAGSYVLHLVCYWTYSLIWDMRNTMPYDKIASKKVIKHVLLIQTTVLPTVGCCFSYLYAKIDNDYLLTPPKFSMFELYQWTFLFLWIDLLFYHSHRLLHFPFFYKYHKLHHTWIKPIPWEALYSSPFENVVSNFIPVLSGALIIKLNIYYLYILVIISTLSSVSEHTPSSFHSKHHKYSTVNYGVTRLFDIIYNTCM